MAQHIHAYTGYQGLGTYGRIQTRAEQEFLANAHNRAANAESTSSADQASLRFAGANAVKKGDFPEAVYSNGAGSRLNFKA